MNPAWITAGVAVAGFCINAFWSAVNLRTERRMTRLEARIAIQVASLKQWFAEEYVSERVCRDRMKMPPLTLANSERG